MYLFMKNKIYIYSTIAIIVLIGATFGDLMTKSTAK